MRVARLALARSYYTTASTSTRYTSIYRRTSPSSSLGLCPNNPFLGQSKLAASTFQATRQCSSHVSASSSAPTSSIKKEESRSSDKAVNSSDSTASEAEPLKRLGTTGSTMWTSTRVPPTPKELLETNEKWIADNDPELFLTTAKGQKPSIMWIGCADSRVPAELVTGAAPGDLFVHRNIANTFSSRDGSAFAALAYAVNVLGVQHVIICGHQGCGGVQAAMQSAKDRSAHSEQVDEGTEAIQQWLAPIRALAVAEARAASTAGVHTGNAEEDELRNFQNLVEKNVCAQVSNVASCSVVKNAWRAGKKLTIHGWVYDLATGKINDLGVGEGSEV